MKRVVVVGAGMAGLVSATALARAGFAVTCAQFGVGGIPLTPGVVDVYGYAPGLVADPLGAVSAAPAGHPYATIGRQATTRGLDLLRELAGSDMLAGDAAANTYLPTAVGAWRPACLYPPSMAAGRQGASEHLVIVGLARLKDFYPQLIAGNLAASASPDGQHPHVRAASVDVVARPGEADSSGMAFARFFDTDDGRRALVNALRPLVGEGETVGLPAVLGLEDATAWRKIQDALGHPVFEIPLPPPSVPGWRLTQALVRAAENAGVRFMRGSRVVEVRQAGGRATGVVLASAGHPTLVAADAVVLATGGFESGGLAIDSHHQVAETVMGLPLANVPDEPFTADAFGPQPAFLAGVRVDEAMHPLDDNGAPVLGNLHAVGGLLAGSIRWDEKTGEGIAVGSAVAAADAIGKELA